MQLNPAAQDTPDHDYVVWQSKCGIQKLLTEPRFGCGTACLSMVTGMSFDEGRRRFIELGLGVKRGKIQAFSTTFSDMRMAVGASGLIAAPRRWTGWANFNGLGLLKVRADWRGPEGKGKWYWVVAFTHSEFGIVVFDPYEPAPAFTRMPLDIFCTQFDLYEPKGQWLQVEQRIKLQPDMESDQ